MDRKDPNAAHAALVADMHAVMDRYAVMPAIERVACLAQALGHVLADVPTNYSPADVMRAVSKNIEVGNETATRDAAAMATLGGSAPLIGGPTGL